MPAEEVAVEEVVVEKVEAPVSEELVVAEYITLDEFIERENLPSFYRAALLHKLGYFARPTAEWYVALKIKEK